MKRRVTSGKAMICLLLSYVAAAVAANHDWTNTAGGGWEDTNSRSLGRVPNTNDDVRVNASGTYTVTVGQTAALAGLRAGSRSKL